MPIRIGPCLITAALPRITRSMPSLVCAFAMEPNGHLNPVAMRWLQAHHVPTPLRSFIEFVFVATSCIGSDQHAPQEHCVRSVCLVYSVCSFASLRSLRSLCAHLFLCRFSSLISFELASCRLYAREACSLRRDRSLRSHRLISVLLFPSESGRTPFGNEIPV